MNFHQTKDNPYNLHLNTRFSGQLDSLGVNAEIGLLPYKYGSFSVAVPASVNPSLYNSIVIANSISYAISGYARI